MPKRLQQLWRRAMGRGAAAGTGAGRTAEPPTEAQFVASPWRLVWWKFSRHRLAVASMFILVAFYLKRVGGTATFIAALVAESVVIACFAFTDIPYLWFNVIGCVVLVPLAMLLESFLPTAPPPHTQS